MQRRKAAQILRESVTEDPRDVVDTEGYSGAKTILEDAGATLDKQSSLVHSIGLYLTGKRLELATTPQMRPQRTGWKPMM